METPWPYRLAILLAAIAFLSMVTGGAVTSNEERPFYSVGQTHLWLGAASAILTIALAIGTRAEKEPLWLRRLCRIALAAVVVQVILGLQPLPQAPAVRIAHAFAAQIFFPITVAIACCSSAGWKEPPKQVEGPAFLRLLATCTPVVVLAQVALGGLFRHGALGVGPHLIGAFVVAMVVLGLALPIIYGPEDSPLRLPAQVFLAIASVQIVLGLGLFSIQLMEVDPQVIILVTMIHTATGALTLAATLMMGVLIRRSMGHTSRGRALQTQSHGKAGAVN